MLSLAGGRPMKNKDSSMVSKNLNNLDNRPLKEDLKEKKRYEAVEYIFERDDTCPLITSAQLEAFEKIVDKLFKV